MDLVYLDSSALVKNYVHEPGSQVVQDLLLTTDAKLIYVAMVIGAEVVAGLKRNERSGKLTQAAAFDAVRKFRDSFASSWNTLEVDRPIVEAAMQLAIRHAIRGYDAIQLASAVDLHNSAQAVGDSATLWSSDQELLSAARAEGLAVVDPSTQLDATSP